MNIRISVAVCDAGGRLMAFNRMDNAVWGGVRVFGEKQGFGRCILAWVRVQSSPTRHLRLVLPREDWHPRAESPLSHEPRRRV